MKKTVVLFAFFIASLIVFSFKRSKAVNDYSGYYYEKINKLNKEQLSLVESIKSNDINDPLNKNKIKQEINKARRALKGVDFWLRYLEPISYKQINGPLPVEWETEVFEKFEKPYKRLGGGLTLSTLYLDEDKIEKDTLLKLIQQSITAINVFEQDSITATLKNFDHFYLCNRLFLLNLATIYTTGFECPETEQVIPELEWMLNEVSKINNYFNMAFPNQALNENYLTKFELMIQFVKSQPKDFELFDHYSLIKEHVNPLFSINQQHIRDLKVVSKSYIDYSLNKNANSIFSKHLYHGQNAKGLFIRVVDPLVLAEIDKLGKLLFYDPILSGNNLRSCSSCHKPTEFFTDTLATGSLQFNRSNLLQRNTPSLVNASFNHLLMHDGFHISMQNQAKAVITNSIEMGGNEKDILKKILSCKDYKTAFKKLLEYTPQEKEITFDHIASALSLYYNKFSSFYSPFDRDMNNSDKISANAKKGFNIYMSKAQCATCHFAPQFNGVKPPYVGSEFEVLGVPKDETYKALSSDRGRYEINPAFETMNAFRTGTIRNAMKTKPYMHNGVFDSMEKVIDFYNDGGGAGHGLKVDNQTLSADSLHLNDDEKKLLIEFISTLTESVEFELPPQKLPVSNNKKLNSRKVNGEY